MPQSLHPALAPTQPFTFTLTRSPYPCLGALNGWPTNPRGPPWPTPMETKRARDCRVEYLGKTYSGPGKMPCTLEKMPCTLGKMPYTSGMTPLTQQISWISIDTALHLGIFTYLYENGNFCTKFFLVCLMSHRDRLCLHRGHPSSIAKLRVWLCSAWDLEKFLADLLHQFFVAAAWIEELLQ